MVYSDHMAKSARVSLVQAKAQLSRLVDQALRGDDVLITRHGRPVARLVAAKPERRVRELGALRGKIRVAKDFDAPLPAALQALFEGRGS